MEIIDGHEQILQTGGTEEVVDVKRASIGKTNICKQSSGITSKSWIGLNIRFEYKARSASQERRL